MLNKKARKIIGYERIVKELAVKIPENEMEYIETKQLQDMLGTGYERWEFQDWYRLLVDIKKEQRKEQHSSITTDVVFEEIPWACQQSAQEAVNVLLKKAAKNQLFKMDETADMTVNILWTMFYCIGYDIKMSAKEMHEKRLLYSYNDMKENKLLYDFIKILRDRQWYHSGEVARLRTRELA